MSNSTQTLGSYIQAMAVAEIEFKTGVTHKEKYQKNPGYSLNLSPGQGWQAGYQHNIIKLSLLILQYLFGSDDGVVSKKEIKIISKLFKKNKDFLSPADLNEIIENSNRILGKQDVLNYIEEKKFSDQIVNESVKLIKEYAVKDYAYIKALNEISK